jgi:hypothetical protein
VLEIAVLNAGLDDIEGRGDDERCRRTAYRRNEVLAPGRGIVVLQFEDLLFGERGAAEQGKRSRRIAGGCPTGAAVETHALIGDDAEEAPRAEGVWVGLPFYLEHVEREEDDLADADQRAGGGVHDCFACAFAEGGVEVVAVVLGEVVADEGLAAVFVNTLQDLRELVCGKGEEEGGKSDFVVSGVA